MISTTIDFLNTHGLLYHAGAEIVRGDIGYVCVRPVDAPYEVPVFAVVGSDRAVYTMFQVGVSLAVRYASTIDIPTLDDRTPFTSGTIRHAFACVERRLQELVIDRGLYFDPVVREWRCALHIDQYGTPVAPEAKV